MSRRATKPTKWPMRPAKTQIIRPVWSEYSLYVWRNLGSLATHWAHGEDSDQTGRMRRLIWVFAGRTGHFVDFVMRWLNLFLPDNFESNFFLYIPELNIDYLGLKFLIKSTALTGFGLSPLPKQRFMHDDLGTRTSLVQYWTIRKKKESISISCESVVARWLAC